MPDESEVCTCGHQRRWHGQESLAEPGSGECEALDARRFEGDARQRCRCERFRLEQEPVDGKAAPPSELECDLAEELAFALTHRGQLAERALSKLEDHVLACRASGVDPHPEVIAALDGFRGEGKWPLPTWEEEEAARGR